MLARSVARSCAAPFGARGCAFITKMKTMEAAATKLQATLPEELKGLAAQGPSITASLEEFAKSRPELYKDVIAKIKEADAPGVRATVAEPKDPSSCKYTEEGTMVHEFMASVAKTDRRMRAISELEVTLTAADKESIKKLLVEKATDYGIDPKTVDMAMPDKMSLSF